MKSLFPPQCFSFHNNVTFKTEGRKTFSMWVLCGPGMAVLLPHVKGYIVALLLNMLPTIFPNLTLQQGRASYQSISLSKCANRRSSLSISIPGSENHHYNCLSIFYVFFPPRGCVRGVTYIKITLILIKIILLL